MHLVFFATLCSLLVFVIVDYKSKGCTLHGLIVIIITWLCMHVYYICSCLLEYQNYNESGENSHSDTLATNVLYLLSSWMLMLSLVLLSAGW